MEEKIKKAYERLKGLYSDGGIMLNHKTRLEYNPPKISFGLKHNGECYVSTTNIMFAKTDNGNLAKTISLDDETGEVKETIIYTNKNMNTEIFRDLDITRVRCSLMAALAADLNYNISAQTKIGFIGNGKINIKTAKVLSILFGIKECVIRGSKSSRGKNKDEFENALGSGCKVIVDDTADLNILNKCDVIICCTTSINKSDMISHKELSKPKLIISQDCGYLLDETFRDSEAFEIYTDHEEQIMLHYHDEFPFDTKKVLMKTMRRDASDKKKAVYLYGIAEADIIVLEELYLSEVEKC